MIKIIKEDITKLECDVIVNAANNKLLGGGGVDGAIHNAAGPELLDECIILHGCNTGEAKITKGYNLPAKYVIHTVSPRWYSGDKKENKKLLINCYINSFELAKENNLKTIAFPCLGMGHYLVPLETGSQIALKTALKYKEDFDEIYLVCFDDKTYEFYLEEQKFAERFELIDIFYDTNRQVKDYKEAYEDVLVITEDMIKDMNNNKDYDSIPTPNENIIVVKGDTYEITEKYKDYKTCAICFASATNAGGGVERGAKAQEEGLCRSSSLFRSLDTSYMWDNYYNYHQKINSCLYTDRFYHVPNVKVIKDRHGHMLSESFECGVVGIAAPNLRPIPSNYMNPNAGRKVEISDEKLEELLITRYTNMIKFIEKENYEVVILGAIGCGAFSNPPELVARVFKKILNTCGGKLKKVVFAIYDAGRSNNYEVFNDILK